MAAKGRSEESGGRSTNLCEALRRRYKLTKTPCTGSNTLVLLILCLVILHFIPRGFLLLVTYNFTFIVLIFGSKHKTTRTVQEVLPKTLRRQLVFLYTLLPVLRIIMSPFLLILSYLSFKHKYQTSLSVITYEG